MDAEKHHSKKMAKRERKPMLRISEQEDDSIEETKYSDAICARFLYKPFVPLPDISKYILRYIEIKVSNEYITKSNKAFILRNFYGNDIYTANSDIVCIL